MAIGISVCAALLVCLLLMQAGDLLTRRQRHLRGRLKLASGQSTAQSAGGQTTDQSAVQSGSPDGASVALRRRPRYRLPVIPKLGTLFGGKYLDRMRVDLTKAGIPLRPEELASMAAVAGAVGAAVGLVTKMRVLASLPLGLAGMFLPSIWVNSVKHRRSVKLDAQLVDSLTLIANSLRAGHSFMQALEVTGRDMGPPLAPELARVLRDTRLGVSLDEAFQKLLERFQSRELELTVTGVLIQRQVGGNLAEVLDTIASTIEKRVKARAKVRTLTAQGRLSAWIVSLLPFALGGVMFTMYPEFARTMLESPLGIGMLVGAVVLLAIGVFVIKKVVNVDV